MKLYSSKCLEIYLHCIYKFPEVSVVQSDTDTDGNSTSNLHETVNVEIKLVYH